MAAKSIFEEIESRFSQVPIARGKNVFLAVEYAQNAGISARTARERLSRLAGEGLIRKVRTSRDNRLVLAWEFIGKRTK